jgi:hypothetical protein
MATVAFALCQAASAYALSFVFSQSGGNYRLLFSIGAIAMVAALAIDLIATVATARTTAQQHPDARQEAYVAEDDKPALTPRR